MIVAALALDWVDGGASNPFGGHVSVPVLTPQVGLTFFQKK